MQYPRAWIPQAAAGASRRVLDSGQGAGYRPAADLHACALAGAWRTVRPCEAVRGAVAFAGHMGAQAA